MTSGIFPLGRGPTSSPISSRAKTPLREIFHPSANPLTPSNMCLDLFQGPCIPLFFFRGPFLGRAFSPFSTWGTYLDRATYFSSGFSLASSSAPFFPRHGIPITTRIFFALSLPPYPPLQGPSIELEPSSLLVEDHSMCFPPQPFFRTHSIDFSFHTRKCRPLFLSWYSYKFVPRTKSWPPKSNEPRPFETRLR